MLPGECLKHAHTAVWQFHPIGDAALDRFYGSLVQIGEENVGDSGNNMKVLRYGQVVQQSKKNENVATIASYVQGIQGIGIGPRHEQAGQSSRRKHGRVAAFSRDFQGASVEDHVGDHERGDQPEDHVCLFFMAAGMVMRVTCRTKYGSPYYGYDAHGQDYDDDVVLENFVREGRGAGEQRQVEFRREAAAYECQRTERQDHKPSEKQNVEDPGPQVPGLPPLAEPIDEHQADSFSNVGESIIGSAEF